MTGIPIVNVNNNCSTGSTALFLARQAIASGAADCVLAIGFEQMKPGALGSVYADRPSPFEDFDALADTLIDAPGVPLALRYFGGAGLAHMKKYGTKLDAFAKIRAKASRHAKNNPMAIFRKEVTADDVMNDTPIWPGVMTRLMACPPTCGGAAAILVSETFARRHGLRTDVSIKAQAMTTDTPSTFETKDMMRLVGYDMAKAAANKVYEQSGVGPEDIDVVELHDCFAQNELITYEALGLCPEGGAEAFIEAGDNTYGGMVVTNPSRRAFVQGPPARRDGPGAMLRADPPVARNRRGDAGRRRRTTHCSTISGSAAPASSPSTSGCEAGPWLTSPPSGAPSRRSPLASSRVACAISSIRSARPIRSIAIRPRRRRPAIPRLPSRRPISSVSK